MPLFKHRINSACKNILYNLFICCDRKMIISDQHKHKHLCHQTQNISKNLKTRQYNWSKSYICRKVFKNAIYCVKCLFLSHFVSNDRHLKYECRKVERVCNHNWTKMYNLGNVINNMISIFNFLIWLSSIYCNTPNSNCWVCFQVSTLAPATQCEALFYDVC